MADQRQYPLRAAVWMIGAIISFSAMAVAGREMASELDTFEIMLYRSVFGVLVITSIALAMGKLRSVATPRFTLHFWRNVMHFTGQNLWFYAVTLIPLAQLFAFEFSVPIWIMLAAPFLLGERLTGMRVFAVIGGFIGILIVTRPWLGGISIGILVALGSAIFFAATGIATKRLTKTESLLTIMFWLTAIQLVLGLITAGIDGDIALPSTSALPFVLIVGVGGLVAHTCLTKALSLADATLVTPVDFARLPIIAAVGFFLYNEPLDAYIIGGAVIIFVANYLNIWSETQKKRIA